MQLRAKSRLRVRPGCLRLVGPQASVSSMQVAQEMPLKPARHTTRKGLQTRHGISVTGAASAPSGDTANPRLRGDVFTLLDIITDHPLHCTRVNKWRNCHPTIRRELLEQTVSRSCSFSAGVLGGAVRAWRRYLSFPPDPPRTYSSTIAC